MNWNTWSDLGEGCAMKEYDDFYGKRLFLTYLLMKYNTRYVDAVWEGYQANKQKLDEHEAFFAELFEDELLSKRKKILKYLCKKMEYEAVSNNESVEGCILRNLHKEIYFDLRIREVWRKYLIRFKELKEDLEKARAVYDKILNHIPLNPFWEFTYGYEDVEGKVKEDRLCICHTSMCTSKDNIWLYDIDKYFLQVFLYKTWDKIDPLDNMSLKKYYYEDEFSGEDLTTDEEADRMLAELEAELEKED